MCVQDEVNKIQLTTKETYTVRSHNNKKLCTVTIADPEYALDPDFELFPDVKLGDYVLVRSFGIVNLQTGKSQYVFKQKDGEVLTREWEAFEEDMTVADLVELDDDFLLYYQRIDTGTKACKTPQTSRAKPTKNKGKEETSEGEEDKKQAGKKPAKKRKR